MKTAKLALVCVGLVIISLVFTKGSYAEINPEDIAGIWLLNEGEGDTVEDTSGNENHGTMEGNIEWVEGKFGKALEFDGEVGSIVKVPSSNIGTAEQLTVSVLVKPDEQTLGTYGDHKDIIRSHKFGGGKWGFTTHGGFNNSNKIRFHIVWIEGGDRWWMNQDELVAVKDEWNYLTMILDRAEGKATFYRNGQFIAEITSTVGVKPVTTGFAIGSDHAGPFKGVVDEVAIFNTALDEENISLIATKGIEEFFAPSAVAFSGKLTTTWGEMKVKE